MKFDFKKITEELIPVFDTAGLESINLYKKGLKIEIKEDGSPVSNGDLKVNDLISKKIKELTPEIPIISEETVNIKEKNKNSISIIKTHGGIDMGHNLIYFMGHIQNSSPSISVDLQ